MKYEYKVIDFVATVKTSDIIKQKAGGKISGQLEALFEDFATDGWELQGQYTFNVRIKAGCLMGLINLIGFGSPAMSFPVDQLVFRRPV